jgi:hypothetical protein
MLSIIETINTEENGLGNEEFLFVLNVLFIFRWYNTLQTTEPTVFGNTHYLTHHKVNMGKRNLDPGTKYSMYTCMKWSYNMPVQQLW